MKKRSIGIISKAEMKKYLPSNISFSTTPMDVGAALVGVTGGFVGSSKVSQVVTDFLQDTFKIDTTGNVTGLTKAGLALLTTVVTHKSTANITARVAGFAAALGMTASGVIDLLKTNLNSDQLAYFNLNGINGYQNDWGTQQRSLPFPSTTQMPAENQFGKVVKRTRVSNAA